MLALSTPLAPMAEYAQFILFKLVPRPDGRTDKLPVDHRTLQVFIKGEDWQQDPKAWTTAANACAMAKLCGPDHGVGFFFTAADPFFFLDIDKCLQGNEWTPLALELINKLPGAAVEVSQSGAGLHIFGRYGGPAPDHAKKNEPLGLELYTEKRFVALTGDRIQGSAGTDCTANLAAVIATYYPPKAYHSGKEWTTEAVAEYTGPTDDDELIKRACLVQSAGSAFGGGSCSFKDLWEANEDALGASYPDEEQGRSYNASRADAALAQHLAFWTGKNCARILLLMQRSNLVRDKWEEREDYLEITITNAVAMQEAVYSVVKIDTDAAEALGAPKLKGSSAKQIEFAAQVRAEKLAACAGDCDTIDALCVKHGPSLEAKFWLDNRDKTAEELAAMVAPLESAAAPLGSLSGPEFVGGYQFLGSEQQAEYFKGCVYVQDVHKIFTPSGALLKPEQFNTTYGGYDFELTSSGKPTKKAFDAFTLSQVVRYPKAQSTCFRPELPSGGLIEQDEQVLVNSYVPIRTPRSKGDVSRVLELLAKMIPVEQDRKILLAYMAACVQHKGVKFQWAPLIQGVPGNGKTCLTRCVAAAIGRRHSHLPKASEIGEKFNEWLFDKLFIGVEDVFVPDQKREVWEILKPMITGEWQPCRAMQSAEVMRECCANFIFNANYMDAIRKTEDDRRIAPFFTAQQVKADKARDGMGGNYFPDLYDFLKGVNKYAGQTPGYDHVSEFLYSYPIPDELNPALGHEAPITSSTNAAIAAGLGSVEQEILEAVDEGRPGFAGGWISSMALEMLLKSLRRDTAIPINKRRDLLRTLGYDWHPALKNGRVNNTIQPDNGKPRLFIRAGHISANLTTAGEAVKAYSAAQVGGASGAVGDVAEAFNND